MESDYKWIAQDECGDIWRYHTNKPIADGGVWFNGNCYGSAVKGYVNPNWRDSLIDLEKEDYEIVDGILVRKPRAWVRVATTETVETMSKHKLTDTELLDAIVEHELLIDVTDGVVEVRNTRTFALSNKKGNIRKAIKKWLRKNT